MLTLSVATEGNPSWSREDQDSEGCGVEEEDRQGRGHGEGLSEEVAIPLADDENGQELRRGLTGKLLILNRRDPCLKAGMWRSSGDAGS